MTKSIAITVRIDPETSVLLDHLAAATKRSKSFLAGAAISDYVEKETAILAGIEAGIEDREAGRVVAHEKVMDNIDQIIDEWGQNKS